jgi:hypothetical protein
MMADQLNVLKDRLKCDTPATSISAGLRRSRPFGPTLRASESDDAIAFIELSKLSR